MSTSALDLIVRKIGQDAGIELSAHTLRHIPLTTLVRNGNDLVLVGRNRRAQAARDYQAVYFA